MGLTRGRNRLVRLLLTFFSLVGYSPFLFADQGCHVKPIVLLWQVPKSVSETEMATFRRNGIQMIQHFQLTNWSDDEISDYLTLASKNNIRVLVYLVHLLDRAGTDKRTWSVGEKAKRFIEKWRNHPAIYGWHSFDEPKSPSKLATANEQIRVYKNIKQLDAIHPVVLSTNLTSPAQYKTYFSEDAFDILEIHAYPNDDYLIRQRILIHLMQQHRTKNYPVWMTLRAFNGDGWNPMSKDGLANQYEHVCQFESIAGVGLYGWKLNPNQGISDLPEIRSQFDELVSKRSMQGVKN